MAWNWRRRPADPHPPLSPAATGIIDQLVDIAHDEGDPKSAGIEWYTPDEEPPWAALEELKRAKICQHHREGESVIVRFTSKAASHYV